MRQLIEGVIEGVTIFCLMISGVFGDELWGDSPETVHQEHTEET